MDVQDVLKECIDENAFVRDWNREAGERLNLYLAGKYDFQAVTLMEEDFLLLSSMCDSSLQILIREKERIETASGMPVAFYFEHISPFRKKNLLKNHVAFIDADQEIYLPFLALRIRNREQNREQHAEYAAPFAPGTQLVFLYLLYQPEKEFSMSEIAAELDVSVMTAQRSLQVLYGKGLVTFRTTGKTGREKRYKRIERTSYYQKGQCSLTNPVAGELFVKQLPQGVSFLKSDLTALGEQTMLGEPVHKTVAVPDFDKKQLEKFLIMDRDEIQDSEHVRVQIMKYNILALSNTEYIDPITLILSLSNRDERIDQAVDELMEDKTWYQE